MYCSGCGQLLESNQPRCSRCGKYAVTPPAQTATPGYPGTPGVVTQGAGAQLTRVQKNVQALGILWIVYAVMNVIEVVVAATLLTGMTGIFGNLWGLNRGLFWERFPFYNAPWVIPVITTFVIARAVLAALAGWGLLQRAPWARTLALVAAFLTLLRPVLGTAIGIYTLVVLISAQSRREYEAISQRHF